MKNNKKQSLIICILLLHNSFSYTNQSTMQTWGTWFWNKMCENKVATITIAAVLGIVGYTLKCKRTSTPPQEPDKAPTQTIKTDKSDASTAKDVTKSTIPEQSSHNTKIASRNEAEVLFYKLNGVPNIILSFHDDQDIVGAPRFKTAGPPYFQLNSSDATKAGAIVNAANEKCLGGGGIDGAITEAGGDDLADARKELLQEDGVRCPTGQARLTIGGDITNASFVIHAVGPNGRNRKQTNIISEQHLVLLKNAYLNSLIRAYEWNKFVDAKDNNVREEILKDYPEFKNIPKDWQTQKIATIAFPAISAAIFGYPPSTTDDSMKSQTIAQHVLNAIVTKLLEQKDHGIENIKFVFYEPNARKRIIPSSDFEAYKKAAKNNNNLSPIKPIPNEIKRSLQAYIEQQINQDKNNFELETPQEINMQNQPTVFAFEFQINDPYAPDKKITYKVTGTQKTNTNAYMLRVGKVT